MPVESRTNHQSLESAIRVLGGVVTDKKQASLDSKGNIFLEPRSANRQDRPRGIFQIFARKDLSVARAIREKMTDQLISATGATRERCLQIVKSKVELRHIQKEIDRGTLRPFAAGVMREATAEMYRPASDSLNRLKTLLPTKLVEIFDKTGAFKLSRSFSKESQEKIMRGFTSLQNDLENPKQMGEDGIHLQTRKDFARAGFSFRSGQSAVEFRIGQDSLNDIAIGIEDNFKTLADGSQNVLKVLTTVVGQRALAAQFIELGTVWDNPSQFAYPIGKGATTWIEYGFKGSAKSNAVIVTLDYYRGGSQLTDGDVTVPIKTSLGPEAPVGPDNYAIKCSVAIRLMRADMEQGLIKPEFVGSPGVKIQFTPDF